MTEIAKWRDKHGVLRCSHTERSDRPRVATALMLSGMMSLLANGNVIIVDFYPTGTAVPHCDIRFL